MWSKGKHENTPSVFMALTVVLMTVRGRLHLTELAEERSAKHHYEKNR